MLAAMAGFSVEDALLKSAAKALPVWQVMVVFGAGGAALFATLALARGIPLFPPAARHRTLAFRALFELAGRLFYTLALAYTALSSTSAILQATPIVVVAGAALFFGEQVGWRRWTAIVAGLAGVLIVLRPGAETFTPASLLAVAGMLGFAFRDLATRATPRGVDTLALGLYGFVAVVVAGGIYAVVEGRGPAMPGGGVAVFLLAAILVGVASYSCLTLAMRTGEVSAVTPLRYTRLLFGAGLGIVVFGERPDLPLLLGSLVIVGSGLYILARGRRAAG